MAKEITVEADDDGSDMSRFSEHRTITIELWANEDFDFEAVKAAIEGALEAFSNGGQSMDWDTTAEA